MKFIFDYFWIFLLKIEGVMKGGHEGGVWFLDPPGGCHGHTLTRSGWGVFWTRPKACRGVAEWGVPGGWAPRTPEKFSKIFIKKPMENYHFRPIFQNFNENFVKNVSWRKFGKIFEVFIYTGFGGRSPLKLAILLRNSQKSNGNLAFFENFHKLGKKIWFVEANLNKNYSNFDGLLKIFSKSIINYET